MPAGLERSWPLADKEYLMTTALEETLDTFDLLSRQQLEIYARELQQHFREERRLRQLLREHNGQLEQRMRELTALNTMFQAHLQHCDLDAKDSDLQRMVAERNATLDQRERELGALNKLFQSARFTS